MDYWGGGGGGKGYVGPPPQIIGGAWLPLPPSSYAYEIDGLPGATVAELLEAPSGPECHLSQTG